MHVNYKYMREYSSSQARQIIGSGDYEGHTAGLARGKLQANLIILPANYALDFGRFCQRNPKACPIIGITRMGDFTLATAGQDIDLRSDLPAYNIYRDGELDDTVTDISDLWQEDFVAFALGCSFSFESALESVGIEVEHISTNKAVPMFETNIPCVSAEPFASNLVVSQRNFPTEFVRHIAHISRRHPLAFGEPVHIGDPRAIGIDDIDAPNWGDAMPLAHGKTPMFWACGVTPQLATHHARPPIYITQKQGHMLITDIPDHVKNPIIGHA